MNRSAERILLILNPSSGFISKDIAVSLILKKLRRHFASVSLVNTNSPLQASEITRQGLKHFDVFVAFGGDGTVNSVATSLLNTNKTLGILPGGSGNGLARNLGIPLSWLRALDTLISGQDVFIDAGKHQRQLFFQCGRHGAGRADLQEIQPGIQDPGHPALCLLRLERAIWKCPSSRCGSPPKAANSRRTS